MHGRRRGEPDGLADLAHRRRVAVRVDVVGQVVPDLLLSAGQHRGTSGSVGGNERVFASQGRAPPDGVKRENDRRPPSGGPRRMRWRGLEPPRGINPTRPSTLRVYQFRHQRAPAIVATPSDSPAAHLIYAPMRELCEHAVAAALGAGASYADARVVVRRSQVVGTRNGRVERLDDQESEGIGVRVLVGGAWGFACDRRLDQGAREAAAGKAVALRQGRPGRAQPRARAARAGARRVPHARSSATRSRSRSPTRSTSACAPSRRSRTRTSRSPRRRFARSASTRSSSPPRAPRPSRSSSSAAAGSTRWPPATGVTQIRSYPSAHGGSSSQAGWEYVESLGLEREAPRVGEQAAALLRAEPCPSGRDDGRDRRRADGAAGARVGRPPDRARPRLRHRGRLRGHELRQAGRPRLAALRLRAHEHHRRLDHARRARHLRLRRRGRAGRPRADRRARASSAASSPRARRRRGSAAARAARCAPTAGAGCRSCG